MEPMQSIRIVLALFVVVALSLGASSDWPPLPKKAFVRGRPAQEQDVKEGRAAFAASENGKIIGKPMAIVIPQYAYHTQLKMYVIVIQAEDAMGIPMVGVRDFKGTSYVTLRSELQFLGRSPKRKPSKK